MKKNRKRILPLIFAILSALLAFPAAAYANGDDAGISPPPKAVEETAPVTVPLTPEGNLTLVDDIVVEESSDKQFVTLQSKSGNYFYLVIDRSGDKQNVYFLNLVDEADLMALIDETDKKAEPLKVCTCSEKCEPGHVRSDCPVCITDLNQCIGKAAEATEPKPEKKSSASKLLIALILAGGLGGGGFYFLKSLKNNPKAKGNTDPLDYDYDDEEDDESNVINEDYETEDEAESEDEII